MAVVEYILAYVLEFVVIILGALTISEAIKDLKKERYFLFGVDCMLTFLCMFGTSIFAKIVIGL